MIKTTRWRPDTCGCDIEFKWDDSLPEEDRTHTASRVNDACPAHSYATPKEHYDALVQENRHKNVVVSKIAKDFAVAHDDVSFSFDKDRNLEVDARGVDSASLEVAFAGDIKVKIKRK